MKTKALLFLLLLALLFTSFKGRAQAINAQDSAALVDLYNGDLGIIWTNHSNWLTAAPVSSWYGVTVAAGRVTQLSLTSNFLLGNIPSSIGNLSGLTRLVLSGNYLSKVPVAMGNLSSLAYLDLSSNQLNDTIPASLGTLSNLAYLNLSKDQLKGSIPASLGNLSNLTTLILNSNSNLNGINPALGNLTKLSYLDLHSNQLTDTIPASLGNLSNLQYIDLSSDKLTGSIPSTLGNLSKLTSIKLQKNQIGGLIPNSMGFIYTLTYIDMSQNIITGFIPLSFNNLTNLVHLDLNNNLFAGSLSSQLQLLTKLTYLDVSSNQLAGNIPSGLDHFSLLDTLQLGGNQFTFSGMENIAAAYSFARYSPQSAIPLTKQGNTLSVSAGGTLANDTFRLYKSTSLLKTLYKTQVGDSIFNITIDGLYSVAVTNAIATRLILYSNADTVITGLAQPGFLQDSLALIALYDSTNGTGWTKTWDTSKPVSTWYGVTLESGRVTQVTLNFNHLVGTIPDYLDSLTALTYLSLYNNQLTGGIPASLGSLPDVAYLDLHSNSRLGGAIPLQLSGLTHLTFLNLEGDSLSGSIPSQLSALTNLTFLGLSSNQLSGSIPSSLGSLAALQFLDLSRNLLTGNIPPELGNLSNLQNLYLYENQLSGSIPSALGNLTNLTNLSLFYNHLAGSIPPALGNLTKLNDLELGSNFLSGSIPSLPGLTKLAGLGLYRNKFTFDGMEAIVTAYNFASYFPQDTIPLTSLGNKLSVSAGGTLAKDTFRLYKNYVLLTTQVGDSAFTAMANGTYYITITNAIARKLILYSDTVKITTSLPLTLLSFDGAVHNNSVGLQWETAGEINTQSFSVERSSGTTDFKSIGLVTALDTPNQNSYSFTDTWPLTGANYYRLKMQDKDGAFTYSKIVYLNINDANSTFSVYPNPAHNHITISTGKSMSNATIRLINLAGKLLMEKTAISGNSYQLNVAGLPGGIYGVEVNENGKATRFKIVKN